MKELMKIPVLIWQMIKSLFHYLVLGFIAIYSAMVRLKVWFYEKVQNFRLNTKVKEAITLCNRDRRERHIVQNLEGKYVIIRRKTLNMHRLHMKKQKVNNFQMYSDSIKTIKYDHSKKQAYVCK